MLLTTKAEQRKALLEMKHCYAEGYNIGKTAKRHDAYYPLGNRLAAEIVLSGISRKGDQRDAGRQKKLILSQRGLPNYQPMERI